ncbi:NAD/NADP octopine/nopaline dehydrogenase family protein [Georgenia yuyongxinii]|uniref:Opine dehydrogenase domain-containing protein n=1 Tax=Georgenia yuyongxinii TaxID=2589797 RepID=A0A552WSJ8_9MICO|nr:NAD/NADP octopine/nopaline dehydrogenase family protein [Georgenia yuyongxinii]TRW45810.1 hypothetical protein FJ693_07920 [Georgenia yuyongxinii]
MLVVVGPVERSLPVAAVASITSGERVLFTSEEGPGELTVPVDGGGLAGRAVMQAIAPDDLPAGDSFVATGTAEQLEGCFATRPEVFAGKPVLLAPGGLGGVLAFAHRFRQWGVEEPLFSEVPGWMVGGRLQDGCVRIVLRRQSLALAGSGDEETSAALGILGRFFPDLVASDLISTGLGSINALIHPPLALLNATRIDNGELWHCWDEGFTPAVERLMEALDRERLAVVQALHGTSPRLREMALSGHGDDRSARASLYDDVRSSGQFRRRPGPTALDTRFLTDDVPYGIAGWEQLAARLGLVHETLEAVRVLSEIVLGRELRADPYAVDALMAYAQRRTGGKPTQDDAARPDAGTAPHMSPSTRHGAVDAVGAAPADSATALRTRGSTSA